MLLLLLACRTDPAPAPGCDALTGQERDQCLYDEVSAMADASPEAVRSRIAGIEDTIIREAAVYGWVKAHGCAHPRGSVLPLCELIEGRLQGKCRRRIDAIHLCR